MRATPAQVLLQSAYDLFARRLGIHLKKGDACQDHARRAETALQGVILHERLLERVQLPVPRQPLNGHDLLVFDVLHLQETGTAGDAVDQHGARAAVPFAAAEFRPGQPEVGAQHPKQRAVAIQI
jgi:hypothetical protein